MARTPPSESAAAEADPAAPENDEGDLRRSLLRRAALAGVLIAALLGVLAVFDTLNAPPPKKLAVAPPAAVPAPEAAAPAAPAETPAAAAPDDLAATQPSAPAEQEMSDSPTPTATPAEKPERPLTKPARAREAMMRPPAPVVRRPEPEAQLAKLPHVGAPASRPLTRAAALVRHFVLQLGVFSNTANAEELRAKLELAGIPSQIEARVRVGPFKTRAEAEAARAKLRQLGIEPGVLLAVKK